MEPTNAPTISTKTPANTPTNTPTGATATTNAPTSDPTDAATNAPTAGAVATAGLETTMQESLLITGVNHPELSDNLNESSFNESSNGSSQTTISPAVASAAVDDFTTEASSIPEKIGSPTSSMLASSSIIILICIAALCFSVGVLLALSRRHRRRMQAKASQHAVFNSVICDVEHGSRAEEVADAVKIQCTDDMDYDVMLASSSRKVVSDMHDAENKDVEEAVIESIASASHPSLAANSWGTACWQPFAIAESFPSDGDESDSCLSI
jgi:hypothetical protein